MNTAGPTAERIADVFERWLRAEVASSSTTGDVNTYLNDFKTAREGIKGGFDHPKNFSAIKLRSHTDRLNFWYGILEQEPTDEEMAAKMIFAGLMQLSGTYRNQSYLEARDADEYLDKRAQGIGIDTASEVQKTLDLWVPEDDLSNAIITVEDLGKRIGTVCNVGMFAVRRISQRGQWQYDLGRSGTISSRYMELAQRRWLDYTTDALLLSAKQRGGELARVPFWEPKSISSDPPPRVIYPFDPNFSGFLESL